MHRAFLRLARTHSLVALSSAMIGATCIGFIAWQQTASAGATAAPSHPEIKLVRVTTVSPRSIPDERRAIGEIRPRRESDLGFRVSGKLSMRSVDVGATVKKGQTLARIEDQDYRYRLLSAKADKAAAEAVLVEAQASERRIKTLLDKGYTTRADHDATLKNLRSAEAKLESAIIALALAADQLAYTELHAEFDGIVTATASEVGQIVNTGQMIVRLADPKAKDAVFSIAEANFANAAQSNDIPVIAVSLLSNPALTATGRLREIAPVADAATRTYQVKVSLADAPEAMRFGASVAGSIKASSAPVVVLPASALFDKDGKPSVWVIGAGSGVELKPIVVARYEADRVIVAAGLAQGDVVVTAGVNRLRENQKVRFEREEE